ncbi:hypothetical protein SAMN04487936_1235 [Halobacillus dabanensis]|uniref:Uncharacterized protein n=1 Tax=Halobacillus dabanensis TaxID=240302 RepID=A0A1I4AXU0_HALDA|nr:hypothetical protein SAMN04487936_1235 [Halobacillus dabanensis]
MEFIIPAMFLALLNFVFKYAGEIRMNWVGGWSYIRIYHFY